MKLNLFERDILFLILITIAFKNIIFGCMLLPQLALLIHNNFVLYYVALGILGESILVAYFGIKLIVLGGDKK